jgi:hypothetical protein
LQRLVAMNSDAYAQVAPRHVPQQLLNSKWGWAESGA